MKFTVYLPPVGPPSLVFHLWVGMMSTSDGQDSGPLLGKKRRVPRTALRRLRRAAAAAAAAADFWASARRRRRRRRISGRRAADTVYRSLNFQLDSVINI